MNQTTILIVEDDETILFSLSAALEEAGYKVLIATNGQEGLEEIEATRPNLILSDIAMPVMDGYDFYRAIRDDPDLDLIPFIFITAKGMANEIREGKRLGVDDYLPKPFEIEDVLVAVESKLRRIHGIHQASQNEFRKLKSDILNMLSHELRTPMTHIVGYTELIATEREEDLDHETLSKFLAGVKKGSDRLAGLIDNLLVVVSINSGHARSLYETRKQLLPDLRNMILEVVNEYTHLANMAGVKLVFADQSDLPSVEGDYNYLIDALGRVVNNAIKFTNPGGRVELHATADGDEVTIAVVDSGMGIPLEAQPFIFDSFRQIDRQQFEQQGAGLGLTIARGYIEMHDGGIEVDSEKGVGSTFSIVLPVAK